MRSLKKLLAVVVAICVLATFTVPAFAADSATYANADQAAKLNSMGLYSGTNATVFTPDLGATLTREQGIVVLLKLFGQLDAANAMTDADVTTALTAFTDASTLSSWAKKAVAYAVKNNISSGTSATTIDPKGTFTGNQFATLILKEAGFTVADWTTAAADLTTKGVAGASAFATTVLTRDDLVGIAFGALTVNNKDGKTIVAALVDAGKVTAAAAIAAGVYSDVVKASSIAGAGAKKLLVKFSGPVADTTKMVLSVKRDNITVNLVAASTTWNADKTEATLTASYLIQDGKYVVTAKYDTQDATTATADIKAAKVSTISFAGDNGIITDNPDVVAANDSQALRTTIAFKNQYGEDVTSSVAAGNLTVTPSKGQSFTFDKDTGALVIKDLNAAYAAGNTVSVTVVYNDGNGTVVVGSKTLTVAQSANVKEITIGSITTDDTDLQAKPVNVANMQASFGSYYIPLTVKDQYGSILKVADLSTLTIISSNPNILKVDVAANLKQLDNSTAIALLQPAVATATSGTVVITVVSPNGISASGTFEVSANGQINTLTLSQPSDVVKKTIDISIPFAAADQFGNALVSDTDLTVPTADATNTKLTFADSATNPTTITVVGGTLSTKIDYANGNALKIMLNPTADTIVLTAITAGAKISTLTMTSSASPISTTIAGLSSDFKTALQQGQASSLTGTAAFDRVNLQDQYGDSVGLTGGYSLTVAPTTTNGNVAYTAGPETFKADATKYGSESYTITLKNGATVLDEYSFSVQSVRLQDISGFAIDDLSKLYVGATSAADGNKHDVSYSVYGLKGTTKVQIDPALVKGQAVSNTSLDATTFGVIGVTTAIDTSGADKTAQLTAVVDGYNGPVAISKTITYNNAAPEAKVLKVNDAGGTEITDAAVTVTAASIGTAVVSSTGTYGFNFYTEDQYGKAMPNCNYVVTNDTTTKGVAIDATGHVTVTGLPATGTGFTVTAITANGMSKVLKVFLN